MFDDGVIEHTRNLSSEDREAEMMAYVEEQFGLKEESEDEKRKETALERELMKNMGVRKDYEDQTLKKQTEQLFSQFS